MSEHEVRANHQHREQALDIRTWLPDPSHYPDQMTPLSATVWFAAMGRGLHDAMREVRAPFGGFATRTELGWAYEGDLTPDWEPDGETFRAAALDAGRRWSEELGPRAREITDLIHRLRPEPVDPTGAVAVFDRLLALVDEQWRIHFLAVVPAQACAEVFFEAYTEAFGEGDELAPYRLLETVANQSHAADAELWAIAQRAKELGVAEVFLTWPAELVRERLALLRDGRVVLQDLDRYLLRFGGRSRWNELSLPREAEDPQLTIQAIRLFLGGGAPPTTGVEVGAALEARLRAEAPGLVELLSSARAAYELKESHVYDLDYPGLLATREVLAGFGRRLAAVGDLRAEDDVWMLTADELRDLVFGRPGSVPPALVATRRHELAKGLAEGVRSHLGEPPAEIERDPSLEKFYGAARAPELGGGLQGDAASPGTAEGTARVMHGPEDFARVQPGDVLVATTTTPAWTPLFPSLAGIVTETGGVLSHGAIVAREYGIPAVVGLVGATAVIPDGARVRVVGSEGRVELL